MSYHFAGKQSLLAEAALDMVERSLPVEAVRAAGGLAGLVSLLRSWAGDASAMDQASAGVLLEAMREASRDTAIRDRLVALLADYRQAVADLVRADQRRGAFPAHVQPVGLATLLAAAGDGLLLHAMLDPHADLAGAVEALGALLAVTDGGSRGGHRHPRTEGTPVNDQFTTSTALITGASSGIGEATAKAFAEAGWRVFGTSRQRRPDWHGVRMLELDVRSSESVAACVAQVMAEAGQVDVLVNNAGVMHTGIAEETSLDEGRAVFDTNLFGAVRVSNAVLPHMRRRQRGRVINVGSAAAWVGEPGEAFYAASKQALAGYTEALRHEVRPLGIDVSLVEPGAFTTEILASASMSAGRIADYDPIREATERTLGNSLRRGGDPRAVAKLVIKVASTRSPRLRYPIGPAAHWLPLLKVLLPQRMFGYLVRQGYGLPKRIGTRPR